MKRFFINGETANWANLNVIALNTKNGMVESETAIPENLHLQVTIADHFDTTAPDCEAVSDATSGYAFRHGKRRHFILLNGDRVVGWAHFHRKAKDYQVKVTVPTEDVYTVTAKSEQEAVQKAILRAEEDYGDVLSARALTDEEVIDLGIEI